MRAFVKAHWEHALPFRGTVDDAMKRGLRYAAERARAKLVADGRLPYRTGRLQLRTRVDDGDLKSGGVVRLVTETRYASRLYLHPEYKFRTRVNKNAGGRWFDGFLRGADARFLEREMAGKVREILR